MFATEYRPTVDRVSTAISTAMSTDISVDITHSKQDPFLTYKAYVIKAASEPGLSTCKAIKRDSLYKGLTGSSCGYSKK